MNSDGLTAEECAQRAAELLAVYRAKRDEAKRTNRRDPEKQRLVEEAHRIALEIEAWMKEYRRKLKERVT
jgi:hypothetical protein